jgi:hypothetical protein
MEFFGFGKDQKKCLIILLSDPSTVNRNVTGHAIREYRIGYTRRVAILQVEHAVSVYSYCVNGFAAGAVGLTGPIPYNRYVTGYTIREYRICYSRCVAVL